MRTGTVTRDLRATVDLGALRANVAELRRITPADTEIIACVKAAGFGLGVERVSAVFEQEGIRWLSLGSAAEALAIRASRNDCRILLFPPVRESYVEELAAMNITVGIGSYAEAELVAGLAQGTPSVFLKVDCGYGRLGIPAGEAEAVFHRIVETLPSLRIEGVFTHLPFAGEEGLAWVRERLATFGEVVAVLQAASDVPLLTQSLASAGVMCRLESPGANAVCPGQLLFGVEPRDLPESARDRSVDLKPVLTEVATTMTSLRTIPAGTRFGDSGRRVSAGETRLATLPVGFASSMLRRGRDHVVSLLGTDVAVLSVSLEHAVIDVTAVPEARDGTTVYLVSEADGLSLGRFAGAQGLAPVESLVTLPSTVDYDYVE